MAGRLRTVFFGSSDFSIPSLQRMIAEQQVVAVCSQPEKPAGRGLQLKPTAVSTVAQQAGITVLTPKKLDETFVAQIREFQPQLLAVASYGKILPPSLLSFGGAVALNVHPSLLPRYRGATPIQTALRDGLEETGVTIFWMGPGLDDGDIALARSVRIERSDNYKSLHDRLSAVGSDLLGQAARRLSEGDLPRTPQRNEEATFTKRLSKEDLRLQFDLPATNVVNQVRSLSPKPGAWMLFENKRLKVLDAQASEGAIRDKHDSHRTRPGELVAMMDEGPLIAAATGAVLLTRVIPEGKAAMSGADFAKNTARAR